jgi:hypothetical protein
MAMRSSDEKVPHDRRWRARKDEGGRPGSVKISTLTSH